MRRHCHGSKFFHFLSGPLFTRGLVCRNQIGSNKSYSPCFEMVEILPSVSSPLKRGERHCFVPGDTASYCNFLNTKARFYNSLSFFS